MWKTVAVLVLLGLVGYAKGDEIDWYQYHRMPPLHHTPIPFLKCMYADHDYNVQCLTHSIIKPDNSSDLWRYIEAFSSERKRHFAHDLIMGGVCIKSCQHELSKLTQQEQDDLYVPEFPWRERYFYSDETFPNASTFRKNYGRLVNQCVNKWLRENYNLSAYSHLQTCQDNLEEARKEEYSLVHYSFILVLLLIIALVSAGTIVDGRMNKENHLSFYKKDLKNLSRGRSALLCFSLTRNWYRLTAAPKNELGRDLRFILAIRYTTTFIVVLGHVLIGYSFAPNVRPEFIERSYHQIGMLFHNSGATIVQSFFIVAGCLLYISFNEVLKYNTFRGNIKYFIIAIFYRYLRLTPVYAFLILFHASWLYPLGTGSFWPIIAGMEQTYCRKYWWSHLLYINNIYNPKQQCMIQTWYLAADSQLFVYAIFLFSLMWKFPRYKKHFLAASFFVACCIQFAVTYINQYDGIYFMWPEEKRFLIDNVYEEFEKDYITTYTNAGNFFIGIWLGMIYLYIKKNRVDFAQKKWLVWAWYGVPAAGWFLVLFFTWLFVNHTFEKPSVWISLVSVFTRNFWGILAVVFFIGFLSSFKSTLKNFFNWPVFTPLSRLSYGIYLCHMTVGRYMFGELNAEIDLTGGIALTYTVALFVVSNFVALLLCLCIEFPITGLSKELFKRQRANFEEERAKDAEKNNNGHQLNRL